MRKLRIAGIGLATFAGIFLVLIGIGISYSANPSDSYLQDKIDVLKEDNNKLVLENKKLRISTLEKNKTTCNDLYNIRVNEGLRTMTMDSMFEGGYFHLIKDIPNKYKISFTNEMIRISNEGLKNLDKIKDNQELYTCNLSDEQNAMILFLDMYERSVGE